jgi:hypothetical protein
MELHNEKNSSQNVADTSISIILFNDFSAATGVVYSLLFFFRKLGRYRY